jgi:hypothetical protein
MARYRKGPHTVVEDIASCRDVILDKGIEVLKGSSANSTGSD